MTLAEINGASVQAASEELMACCGSRRWVTEMIERRPFSSEDRLLATADEIWRSLDRADWLEAFAHHPRIGEKSSAVPQNARGKAWSSTEQSAVVGAPDTIRIAQQDVN